MRELHNEKSKSCKDYIVGNLSIKAITWWKDYIVKQLNDRKTI